MLAADDPNPLPERVGAAGKEANMGLGPLGRLGREGIGGGGCFEGGGTMTMVGKLPHGFLGGTRTGSGSLYAVL